MTRPKDEEELRLVEMFFSHFQKEKKKKKKKKGKQTSLLMMFLLTRLSIFSRLIDFGFIPNEKSFVETKENETFFADLIT